MSIRVLIVDDSAVMRALLQRKLQIEDDIEVVGAARDAMQARSMIKKLDPDVITLDIEMPGMDGLSFLEKIMALRPTPVIIVSGSTQEGAQATARALQIGAVNCYAKSTPQRSLNDDDGGELAKLIREAAAVRTGAANVDRPARSASPSPEDRAHSPGQPRRELRVSTEPSLKPVALPQVTANAPELIAIGSSTGGVEALHSLLAGFPPDCPPTLIVQHVNATFAGAIVDSLNKTCAPQVALADSDIVLETGKVWLAPGDEKHLMLATAGSHGWRMVLRADDKVSGHRPSVDRLFQSVAEVAGPRALGILLTGMGQDGAKHLLSMAQTGSRTIAQDEASCVVFGMPRKAIELGAAREVLPLEAIPQAIFGNIAPSQAAQGA
ncbi:MAG: chemotaxis response regulator protein-glutamate methylesterase [Pseudomonadota bacterium]